MIGSRGNCAVLAGWIPLLSLPASHWLCSPPTHMPSQFPPQALPTDLAMRSSGISHLPCSWKAGCWDELPGRRRPCSAPLPHSVPAAGPAWMLGPAWTLCLPRLLCLPVPALLCWCLGGGCGISGLLQCLLSPRHPRGSQSPWSHPGCVPTAGQQFPVGPAVPAEQGERDAADLQPPLGRASAWGALAPVSHFSVGRCADRGRRWLGHGMPMSRSSSGRCVKCPVL